MSKVIILTAVILSVIAGFTSSYFLFNSQDTVDAGFENVAAAEDGILAYPRDVAVNRTGYIYVADTGNSIIQVFNADGSFLETFASADKNISTGALNRPYGININGSDQIWAIQSTC